MSSPISVGGPFARVDLDTGKGMGHVEGAEPPSKRVKTVHREVEEMEGEIPLDEELEEEEEEGSEIGSDDGSLLLDIMEAQNRSDNSDDDGDEEGAVPQDGLLSPTEIEKLRKDLRSMGPDIFVKYYVNQLGTPIRPLLSAFGFRIPPLLRDFPDQALLPLLEMALSRFLSKRQKLVQYNTIDDAIDLIGNAKNIIVLTGAGISTSLGIPDFRSDTGIYSKLAEYGLNDPQEMFDIDVFRSDPSIFYSFAQLILPPPSSSSRFTPTHAFIRLLQDKGKLLTNYTQNIDGVERVAGIRGDKLVQCHGSFGGAGCVTCGYKCPGEVIFADIRAQRIPKCPQCLQNPPTTTTTTTTKKGKGKGKKRGGDEEEEEEEEEEEDDVNPSLGVMKPDITFFGEPLPPAFSSRLLGSPTPTSPSSTSRTPDAECCDLLIAIGTSLKVAPVSEILGLLPPHVPALYIGIEAVKHVEFDVQIVGVGSDVVVEEVCRRLNWSDELRAIVSKGQADQLLRLGGGEERAVGIEWRGVEGGKEGWWRGRVTGEEIVVGGGEADGDRGRGDEGLE
ncbi:NAD-dependent histone deacetylase sir2 [Saitoella coloradoensis]